MLSAAVTRTSCPARTETASPSDVRALYSYLAQYGYFPNHELAQRYPGFVPLVEEGPSDEEVFDEHLEQGVREFQARNQLADTGVVDADTLAAMTHERCANPDGHGEHVRADGDVLVDKFAAEDVTFPEPTWSLELMWATESNDRNVFAYNRQIAVNAATPARTGWQLSKAQPSALIDVSSSGRPFAVSQSFELIATFE
jgi:peptidoglycan hydrolase-like protein with peptidoglycan-binding domain